MLLLGFCATALTAYICINSGRISSYCATASEAIHNYRSGAITLRTLYEFMLFKCRMKVTEVFENGMIIERNDGTRCIEVVYYLHDTRYRIVIPKKTGLRPILRIVDLENERDVTNDVREILGPYGNFHGVSMTPRMLGGYNCGVRVIYRRGKKEVTYEADDVIAVDL